MLEILGETLESGLVVGGAYRLERIVGEGGMGVVWAARELSTQRAVALKFLREGREVDPRNQARFLREARAAMTISHPNIAKIETVGETDAGVPFLVMPLLDGESLRSRLRARPLLSPVECARIFVPILDAVMAAHAHQIVHRDLKPENVFLERGISSDVVRVLDFGIAKQLGTFAPTNDPNGATVSASLTSTGAMLGTPIYMAPEQIFGDDDIDARADVWSLGIMLYECLAGRRPTDGEALGPIIKRITTDRLVPLEEARPGLPRRITGLVARMLARDRNERPPLAEVRAMLAGIADAGEGAAPSARAALATTASSRKPQRALVAVAATVLTLLTVGILAGALLLRAKLGKKKADDGVTITPFDPPFGEGGAGAWLDTGTLLREATEAQKRRDGATCMARLDKLDTNVGFTGQGRASTTPASSYAGIRATCMMLVGKCTEGAALYRAFMAPLSAERTLDDNVEGVLIDNCEGDDLDDRGQLLRNARRFRESDSDKSTPTPAQCTNWYETEKRLLPLVEAKGPGDSAITSLAPTTSRTAITCFARAGDCATSLKIYRDNWLATRSPSMKPPSADEMNDVPRRFGQEMRLTPCAGRR